MKGKHSKFEVSLDIADPISKDKNNTGLERQLCCLACKRPEVPSLQDVYINGWGNGDLKAIGGPSESR